MKNKNQNCYNKSPSHLQNNYRPLSKIAPQSNFKNIESNSYCNSPNSKIPIRSYSGHKNYKNIKNSKNIKSPSLEQLCKPPENNTSFFDITELMSNINDDQKTLINKNTKLRNLLIQASSKLSQNSNQMKIKEENYSKEKSQILEELEKISMNYKTYAEGYKNFSLLEDQLKNLRLDYQHNYNVLISYGESLR
jgi:hypothetical protein